MPSLAKKGSEYEEKVQAEYEKKGYLTHRNPKSKFGVQDVLGIADVVATNDSDFILVACAVGRAQTNTVKKIYRVRAYLPRYIKVRYHILKKNGKEEVREY